ncbi:MAG: NUDIX hydrolase [Clostridia bacterium]|nr:NUDIX hydrolase [Clostridia bacterium]MBP3583070.1 NUDIX hydrolase [Clostridia bacterium]MBQ8583514.1 NUDIX hydrolase [Clostridia bacterium]
MKNLVEKQISREKIFKGNVLEVVRDTVELPNGKPATREMCLHLGAVAVIPILPDGRVVMERQYRYPIERVVLEIPAGKLDYKGEDPLAAAHRELREETGAIAGKMTPLGELVASPALISERIQLYLAEELTFGERELDEDEFLEVEYIPLSELVEMVMRGEICDGKTQIAVLKADKILRERKQ